MKMLIIYSDFDIGNMLNTYFSENNFDVILAETVQEALKVLHSQKIPNVILLDMMLSDMDSIDLCVKLRTTDRTRFIPIVFLTQKDERFIKINEYMLGNDVFLPPPWDIEELKLHVSIAASVIIDAPPKMNKISGLSSAQLLESHLYHLLKDREAKWVYISLKIRYFDSFCDVFGWNKGNDIILMLANILRAMVAKYGTEKDFIGHLGKNNFSVITHANDVQKISDGIVNKFTKDTLPLYYLIEEPEQESLILAKQAFPMMPLMYGLCDILTLERDARTPRNISEIASDNRRRRYFGQDYEPPIRTEW